MVSKYKIKSIKFEDRDHHGRGLRATVIVKPLPFVKKNKNGIPFFISA
jgi:hypothetical protein